jgi:hypothetical protein
MLAALAPLLVAASAAGVPPAGDYDARLCVTVATQPPNCGAAQARLAADGGVRIQVDDIAYHLSFAQGMLVGLTTHGNMQVAEFLSSYRWIGSTLMFGDRERGLQYELLLGAPSTAAR